MPDFIDINGYQWTEQLQEWVEGVGYQRVCFLGGEAVPQFDSGTYTQPLEEFGYVCYSVADLRSALGTAEMQPPPQQEPPPSEPPPDNSGGGPVTDPGVQDLPPPAELPPEPPPPVIPPFTEIPPVLAPPLPVLFPGAQIGSNGMPFLPGDNLGAKILNGLGSFLGALLGGIFGGDSGAQIGRLRYDMVNGFNAIWTAIKSLRYVLIAVARAAGAIVKAGHDIWHKVLKPVVDAVKKIGEKVGRIIDKVLKPYLDWMKRVRKLILEIYTKIVLPILNVIQGIRKALALLRLAHVPFAKKLDARLQRLEAKLTKPIQVLLARVNDHSGIINEIIAIQRVLQEPLFTRSIYSYQANLVNSWWASQTVPRTAEQEQEAAALHLQATNPAGEKALDNMLETGLYVAPFPDGPSTTALDELLQQGTP